MAHFAPKGKRYLVAAGLAGQLQQVLEGVDEVHIQGQSAENSQFVIGFAAPVGAIAFLDALCIKGGQSGKDGYANDG